MIPPSRDWTRPHGLPRPTDLPPDDECTDVAAWLAAEFDGLTATIRRHGEEDER